MLCEKHWIFSSDKYISLTWYASKFQIHFITNKRYVKMNFMIGIGGCQGFLYILLRNIHDIPIFKYLQMKKGSSES